MFCLRPHVINGLTTFSDSVNIRQSSALDYWWVEFIGGEVVIGLLDLFLWKVLTNFRRCYATDISF